MPGFRTSSGRAAYRLCAAGCAVVLGLTLAACGSDEDEVTIGLITKQEDNPYWITMREVAQDTARDSDVELLVATGNSDVDVESQERALRSMTERGATGILIAVNDSEALVPAIEEARENGVVVIALDTPTEPRSAVDALFATDNELAGRLIGEYARAKVEEKGLDPRIAMLDLAPGIASGELRRSGFLDGFGIEADDPQIVGSVDTEGDEGKGREGMLELLDRDPGINVVYTVNERAALGAVSALKSEGKDLDDVVVVSVDGGCVAMKGAVRDGDIDATVQQYPQNMAREGVLELAGAERGGETPSGYLDTGAELVTGSPAPGVDSRDIPFGVRNCWG